MNSPSKILDPAGKPARAAVSDDCPNCGADKTKRGPKGGFGAPEPICLKCGYVWVGEVFRG